MSSRRSFPLFQRLPKFEELSNDIILDRFLEYLAEKGVTLYPAQEEAILELFEGKNVILNTPTGSGKSLVAMALHFHSLAMGKRSFYTCPIKALVNEKFLSLCREFGPEQVGMATGDGTVNRDAPIICCTAEILSNMALRDGEMAKVDDVIMDEFHYYSDRDRGVAWQIPLLTLPRARFLLMSATLGKMDFFSERLNELTHKETVTVSNAERPVPLKFEYRETPLHETVQDLINQNAAPVYLVCFTQREAAEQAQNLMSVDFSTKEQKKAILEHLHGVEFTSPYGKEVQKFLKHGIGIHHAGLLPKYRVLVEKLAQTGLLKVISGTDTLGVGVNIPIRTVLFTQACKYDGEKTAILSVRDFHQIAGRAGRKGFDTEGRVVLQAPEHVIENKRLEAKAKIDPKKAKKIVKAKPPERGFVHWDESTFNRLISSQPEPLQSRFQVSHGMLLNVLSRESEDGCQSMRELIRTSHENDDQKKKHRKRAFTLFRSLLDRKIVELMPLASSSKMKKVRVNVDLQEDFSLNHAFALYLIDTLVLLDPESETYALDVLTLVESILENPDVILRKQLDRLKGEKIQELKAEGMEYEERMLELEKLEHPKPLRDFIYDTFNRFSDTHPWVGTDNIRPKSVAREMFEKYQSFTEYIREYDIHRAEGILLRYLSEVYRVLTQTVPEQIRTDDVDAVIEYFGTMLREIDSSLIDEWENLRKFGNVPVVPAQATQSQVAPLKPSVIDPLSDLRSMRTRIQNAIFRFLRAISIRDAEEAFEILKTWSEPVDSAGVAWSPERIKKEFNAYFEAGHTSVRTDPEARRPSHISIHQEQSEWKIAQTLIDAENHNDWQIVLSLLVEPTRLNPQKPVLRFEKVQEIGI